MKIHAIIVKPGFRGSSCLLSQYLFIQKPCNNDTTILKVVGSEDCVRERVTTMGGETWGRCLQPLGNFCNFFEKNSHFNAILYVFKASRKS